MKVWVCLKCGTTGPAPEFLLLDKTYGSARCGSAKCKREKRLFHFEDPDAPKKKKEV